MDFAERRQEKSCLTEMYYNRSVMTTNIFVLLRAAEGTFYETCAAGADGQPDRLIESICCVRLRWWLVFDRCHNHAAYCLHARRACAITSAGRVLACRMDDVLNNDVLTGARLFRLQAGALTADDLTIVDLLSFFGWRIYWLYLFLYSDDGSSILEKCWFTFGARSSAR